MLYHKKAGTVVRMLNLLKKFLLKVSVTKSSVSTVTEDLEIGSQKMTLGSNTRGGSLNAALSG
jgi:hypothetical protein